MKSLQDEGGKVAEILSACNFGLFFPIEGHFFSSPKQQVLKYAQCEKLRILLPLMFYVKSILVNFTVWKIQDISVIQILRETNFEESRSCKSGNFAILGALNFVNLVNFSLQKVQKLIKNKIQSL